MANGTKLWTGAVSAVHTLDGNWAGGDNPEASTDTLVYGVSSNDITGLTVGFDIVAAQYRPDWNKSAGTSGSKIIYSAVPDLRFSANGGTAFLSGTFTTATVDSKSGVSDATMLELAGTVTSLYVQNCVGRIVITDAAALTSVYLMNSPSAYLIVGASVTGAPTFIQDSGRILCGSTITTAELTGPALFTHTAGTATNINLYGASSRFIDQSSGTYTNVRAFGENAVFDGSTQTAVTKTITNAFKSGTGRLNLDNGADTYVVTNGIRDFSENRTFASGRTFNRS
jgi:hypothetical protein